MKEIWLEQYRNIRSATITPARHLTVLYGANGQGKTNILESIYLLGTARSFRNVKVPDLIQTDSNAATVRGTIQSSGVESELLLRLENNTRRIQIDGKTVHRSAELHGKLAIVIFSPDDTAMVKLGPETRRRFLDRSLYTGNAAFLQDYQTYYRTLKQRNVLLKNNQISGLDIWTEQLATAGLRLMLQRQEHTVRLNRLLQKQYHQIAGSDEKVEIVYKPDIAADEAPDAERLLGVLDRQLQNDIRYKTTGRGPHRDDLGFMLQGRPLKGFGSQGQQRSFILALKMAEMDLLEETFGEMPVLLLDDIASELDRSRMSNLLTYIRRQEVQVLITTTDVTPFVPLLQQDSSILRVEEGRLTREGNGRL